MSYERDDDHKSKMSDIIKAKRSIAENVDEPNPSEEELVEYVNRVGARSIGHMKTKRPALYSWVMKNTPQLQEDSKLTERVYVLINGDDGVCKLGNRKTFGTFEDGYKTACGRKEVCACARDLQSSSMSGRVITEKKPKLEKKPVDHKKIMEHARESFKAKTGYENAFQNPDVKAKIRETMIERYGVDHPSKIENHREKIAKTSMERYGVDHWTKDSKWAKDRGEEISKRMLGDEIYDMLSSKEKIESLNMSAREISQAYDISYSTIQRKMSEYGLIGTFQSSEETAVDEYVKSFGIETKTGLRLLEIGNRKRELDIFVPSHNLAIEYCGLYWHSERAGKKDKTYHFDKLKACREKNIKLITIFSDEWLDKRKVCESRIRNALGMNERGPGARECVVDDRISWKEVGEFLNKHHIQGSGQSTNIRYGLRDKNKTLVAVMTFTQARRSLGRRSGDPELLRFCTDGRNLPGAASKLFNKFISDHNPDGVISYCDLRWGSGNLYDSLGFENVGDTGPNYWYTSDYLTRNHRYKYAKHKLIEMGGDETKSEREIAEDMGLDRIWDCGSSKHVWKKS